ncbi:hypothetical protein Acsp05_34870 [Actinokineospora sp. NBRC 105648]|nr:hypothetical protein Acsp05_34870 [Actinokineospora sp. NBRC 105648]
MNPGGRIPAGEVPDHHPEGADAIQFGSDKWAFAGELAFPRQQCPLAAPRTPGTAKTRERAGEQHFNRP